MQNAQEIGDNGYASRFLRTSVDDCIRRIADYEHGVPDHQGNRVLSEEYF